MHQRQRATQNLDALGERQVDGRPLPLTIGCVAGMLSINKRMLRMPKAEWASNPRIESRKYCA